MVARGEVSTRQRPSSLKHGSDRRETLLKHVSDDPRQSNFRETNSFLARFFGLGNRFRLFVPVLEDLQADGPENQSPRNSVP